MKVKVGVMSVCFHRTVTGESESGCDVCLLS